MKRIEKKRGQKKEEKREKRIGIIAVAPLSEGTQQAQWVLRAHMRLASFHTLMRPGVKKARDISS